MGNGDLDDILQNPELAEAVLNRAPYQLFVTDELGAVTANNLQGTTGKRLLPGTNISDALRDTYGIEVTSTVMGMLFARAQGNALVKDKNGSVIKIQLSEQIGTPSGKRRITTISDLTENFKDLLTGLFNANYWMLFAETAYDLAARGGIAQVILVDVNQLNEINDTYGHSYGDSILRIVGQTLRRQFRRQSDILTRKGGDEFYAVARLETGEVRKRLSQFKKEAGAGIEAILNKAAKERSLGHNPIRSGVSYGMAASNENAGKKSLTFSQASNIADERMYAMKRENHERFYGVGYLPRNLQKT